MPKIPGGVGDNLKNSDVDKRELEMGKVVEMEHVGKDPNLSAEQKKQMTADIAKDHLKEIPDYYSRLKKMEDAAKKNAKDSAQGAQSSEKFRAGLVEKVAEVLRGIVDG